MASFVSYDHELVTVMEHNHCFLGPIYCCLFFSGDADQAKGINSETQQGLVNVPSLASPQHSAGRGPVAGPARREREGDQMIGPCCEPAHGYAIF